MTLSELQQAILGLSETQYAELIRWLQDRDWERWEQEFDKDVRLGRLESLAEDALDAKAKGSLKTL